MTSRPAGPRPPHRSSRMIGHADEARPSIPTRPSLPAASDRQPGHDEELQPGRPLGSAAPGRWMSCCMARMTSDQDMRSFASDEEGPAEGRSTRGPERDPCRRTEKDPPCDSCRAERRALRPAKPVVSHVRGAGPMKPVRSRSVPEPGEHLLELRDLGVRLVAPLPGRTLVARRHGELGVDECDALGRAERHAKAALGALARCPDQGVNAGIPRIHGRHSMRRQYPSGPVGHKGRMAGRAFQRTDHGRLPTRPARECRNPRRRGMPDAFFVQLGLDPLDQGRGSVNQKVVASASDVAPTRPPAPSTSRLTMASPMPAPPDARSRDFSTR